jgi:ATP/maltotriose-dependent transcriptional regulator MalT
MAGLPSVLSRCIRAWSQSELGDFDAAIAEAIDALAIAEASGHAFSIITANFVIAVVRLARGDLEEAIRVQEQGLALCRAERMRIYFPAFAVLLAQALALSGRAATAVPMVQKALPAPSDAIYFAPFAVVAASEVYLLAGQTDEAAKFGARALELAKRKRERGYEGWALRVLGEIAAGREPPDVQVAEAYYRDAMARATALGMRPLQGRCHLGLAMLHARNNASGEAESEFSDAATLFEEMGMASWLERTRAGLQAH